MEVDFTRNFLKNLENLKNEDLLQKIQDTIDDVVRANSVLEISNIKKLSGFKVYYRIKIGDYRIGIEKIGKQKKFLTFENRKDIYKKFP